MYHQITGANYCPLCGGELTPTENTPPPTINPQAHIQAQIHRCPHCRRKYLNW